jgi:hypothetical protein
MFMSNPVRSLLDMASLMLMASLAVLYRQISLSDSFVAMNLLLKERLIIRGGDKLGTKLAGWQTGR